MEARIRSLCLALKWVIQDGLNTDRDTVLEVLRILVLEGHVRLSGGLAEEAALEAAPASVTERSSVPKSFLDKLLARFRERDVT